MEIIELLVFSLIVLASLVLLFFVIRLSTRSSKKIELLEILVEQQDYQILLLKQLLKASGVEIINEELEQAIPSVDKQVKTNIPDTKEQPIKKEFEDLGVSEIFPER
ncbi:YebO family protein [Thorsellia anophelis]|uniref:YebO-like protein n=1 Tax=Thorsellia anophelis DSM 18579 TaxID=1123402 RepID=A0A1I0BZ54_9GAMM|nr:YebO family protein [Thorsellia anophelis]SET12121.1 YebO-like protein [Thorsellia anophelis DSM 18579]